MCLAIPVQVTRILSPSRALANIGGIEKEISLALIDEVHVGDYVILHVGYALTRLNEAEAKKTLALFNELAEGGENQ
ncbi:HypC/HybG/HupF family hydrogenase formation chaperone [Legionella londiniensis]|uniref:Hydrogenase expression/formation protein HypC n=1 Tax=Legionella londiniensis TaxID=45068 RepID=A0A0W0VSV9_9GAMM|nr:HypC/HybG/HupF family hydrogenase formation chaperone [Legionella londiniensis]KTD23227.1 hydrogenase expression/formation protein HypC [Legionella londiniensis]STX93762.1 hydrogenase expression/formation protein HypC [Legionella londiniensis]